MDQIEDSSARPGVLIMDNAAEMPRYLCHKRVHALEIDTITDGAISFVEKGYAPMLCPPEMFSRYTPVKGDFYVVYEDGYKSFSPRKAFLDGYSRIV